MFKFSLKRETTAIQVRTRGSYFITYQPWGGNASMESSPPIILTYTVLFNFHLYSFIVIVYEKVKLQLFFPFIKKTARTFSRSNNNKKITLG